MTFDIRTASFLTSFVAIVMAVCLAAAQRYYNNDISAPMRKWARGSSFVGIGMLLFSFRGAIPDWISVILGNIFFMFGQGDILRALWQFGGQKDRPWLAYASAMMIPFFNYYSHWYLHDLTLRIQFFSIFAASNSLLAFFAAMKIKPERAKTGQRIVAVVTLLAGLLLFARAIVVIGEHDQVENLFIATPIQIIVVSFGVVAQSILTLGFVLMCNDRSAEQLAALARIDPLTGLANRRAAIESIEAWMRDQKNPESIGVMLIDADHFKQINDTYGHAAGDVALQNIAHAIAQRMPAESVLARWGGEEFLLATRGQSTAQMGQTAESLRQCVAALHQSSDQTLPPLAVSIGCANVSSNSTINMERLVHKADQALYQAKRNGRNQVSIAEFLG